MSSHKPNLSNYWKQQDSKFARNVSSPRQRKASRKLQETSDTLGEDTIQKKKKPKAKTNQNKASTSALSIKDVLMDQLDCMIEEASRIGNGVSINEVTDSAIATEQIGRLSSIIDEVPDSATATKQTGRSSSVTDEVTDDSATATGKIASVPT